MIKKQKSVWVCELPNGQGKCLYQKKEGDLTICEKAKSYDYCSYAQEKLLEKQITHIESDKLTIEHTDEQCHSDDDVYSGASVRVDIPKCLTEQVGGDHYLGFKIHPAEYCHRNNLSTCAANVVKYVSRHHLKGGLEDLEKAMDYLKMLAYFDYGINL